MAVLGELGIVEEEEVGWGGEGVIKIISDGGRGGVSSDSVAAFVFVSPAGICALLLPREQIKGRLIICFCYCSHM